jgi:HEAT repeat protein
MTKACVVLFVALAIQGAAAAQSGAASTTPLAAALTGLRSPDLATRREAFTALHQSMAAEFKGAPRLSADEMRHRYLAQHPADADNIKTALIRLLKTENDTFLSAAVPPGTYTETEMEYYEHVVEAVASLHDERAMPGLVKAAKTGSIASNAVLGFGDRALPAILAVLNGGADALSKATALNLGVTILRNEGTADSNARIAKLIRDSLADKDWQVRVAAVMLVECRPDRETYVPLLETLSSSDPFRYSARPGRGERSWSFPVRGQARRVLQAVRDRKPCR